MNKCQVCGKLEDERNTQEQCGVTLCVGCDGLYRSRTAREGDIMELLVTLIYVPWYMFQALVIILGWYLLGTLTGKIISDIRDRL